MWALIFESPILRYRVFWMLILAPAERTNVDPNSALLVFASR
jgi:hypothetical protein